MAFLVLALAGGSLWWAFRPSSQAHPAGHRTPAGYYLLLPDQVSAAMDDPNGGARVHMTTNLPEGTVAQVTYKNLGAHGGGGYRCCTPVHQGRLTVTVGNTSYIYPPGTKVSTGFEVTITVRPVFDTERLEGPGGGRPPSQPDAILTILGEHFENLTGDQVTKDDGVNQIVVSRTYDWPADSCAGFRAAMIPEVCDGRHASESISEDNAEYVADSVVGMLLQSRLCELWFNTTPEFQGAHPWAEFKVEWDRWLQSLGPLSGPSGSDSRLSGEVVDQSSETFRAGSNGAVLPERIVADYYYGDRRIAQVGFVHVGPVSQGLVPSFQITRFDILGS